MSLTPEVLQLHDGAILSDRLSGRLNDLFMSTYTFNLLKEHKLPLLPRLVLGKDLFYDIQKNPRTPKTIFNTALEDFIKVNTAGVSIQLRSFYDKRRSITITYGSDGTTVLLGNDSGYPEFEAKLNSLPNKKWRWIKNKLLLDLSQEKNKETIRAFSQNLYPDMNENFLYDSMIRDKQQNFEFLTQLNSGFITIDEYYGGLFEIPTYPIAESAVFDSLKLLVEQIFKDNPDGIFIGQKGIAPYGWLTLKSGAELNFTLQAHALTSDEEGIGEINYTPIFLKDNDGKGYFTMLVHIKERQNRFSKEIKYLRPSIEHPANLIYELQRFLKLKSLDKLFKGT